MLVENVINVLILIFVIVIYIFVSAWKYAPYAYAAISVYGVNYTAHYHFFANNVVLTTLFLIAICFIIIFILSFNQQTGTALYCSFGFFVCYVIAEIIESYIGNILSSIFKDPNVLFVSLFLLLYIGGTVTHILREENCNIVYYNKNIYIMVLLRVIASLIFGYGILVADWVRYQKFGSSDNPLISFPLIKISEIIKLPEKWILLAIFIVIVSITTVIDFIKYKNEKMKIYELPKVAS